MSKVFFIGASKMGTTSISAALAELGLRVTHSPRFGVYSHLKKPKKPYFDDYDYFLDGNFHNFIQLETWWPDAKFIFLDRDPQDWILSILNWQSHIDERHMREDRFLVVMQRLIMGKGVYKGLLSDFLLYRRRALEYFQGKPNFLHVNVVDGREEGWKKLDHFLGLHLPNKWENVQQKKSFPLWTAAIVKKAEIKARSSSVEYPQISPSSLRDRLFVWVMTILGEHFIRERHLIKNIKKVWVKYGWWNPKSYYHSSVHLLRFILVICCLILRVPATRKRRISPFIY